MCVCGFNTLTCVLATPPTPPQGVQLTHTHTHTHYITIFPPITSTASPNVPQQAYDYGPEWDARLRSECGMQSKTGGAAATESKMGGTEKGASL